MGVPGPRANGGDRLERLIHPTSSRRGTVYGPAARAAAIVGLRTARHHLNQRTPGLHIRMAQHIGSPSHPADSQTHQAIERVLYEWFDDVLVLGEEVDREGVVTGSSVVAFVDPIDGTGPARGLYSDFSCVVLLYRLLEGRLAPVAAAIATSGAHVICLDEEGTIGTLDLLTDGPLAVLASQDYDPGDFIAYVGAKQKDHWRLDAVSSASGAATIFNNGGTPTITPLLCAELNASIAFTPQTPWDAAHFLVGVGAGLPAVLIADPEVAVGWEQVYEIFCDPPLQVRDAEQKKVIPPFVIGQDLSYVSNLASRLRGLVPT